MEFAAFLITFHRPESLRNSLRALLAQSQPPAEVLVIDNGNPPDFARRVAQEFPRDLVSYLDAEGNRGPAGAAALGLSWALARGYDWVYWGDDDDPPQTPDTLARLLAVVSRCDPDRLGAVAAVGGRWDWKNGWVVRLEDAELTGPIAVDAVGGGCQLLVARTAVERAGLPRAELFFGWEEIELCLRIRRAGLEILVDGELMHEYRRRHGRLGLPPRPRGARMLSPWRQYYSTRNYVYLLRNSFGRPDLARREAIRCVGRCTLSWRNGIRFGTVFTAYQLRGLIDGYRGKLGLTIDPEAKATAPWASGQ